MSARLIEYINIVGGTAVSALIAIANGEILSAIKVEIIKNEWALLVIELNDVDSWLLFFWLKRTLNYWNETFVRHGDWIFQIIGQ